MTAGARQREEIADARLRIDQLGLAWAATAHRNDDHAAVAREQLRNVTGHGRLANALARSDHCERGQLERLELRRLEPEVCADVGHPEHERPAREPEAIPRRKNRLVGEIDDHVRGHGIERVDEWDAVVLRPAKLLGAADEQRAHEVVRKRGEGVTHDRRIVLAVDHRECAHQAGRTSCSMRAVYFSYSRVSVENWMIFSCPWYGYRRQTSTCDCWISMTL